MDAGSRSVPASEARQNGNSDDRFDVLGVPVSAIDMEAAILNIEEWIRTRRRHFVCVTGVHGVVEARSDPELAEIFDTAGMITPDGMPLVWVARLRGMEHVHRVYGPDLMRKITALSPHNGYRNFFYGGGEGVADALKRTLTAANPGLSVVGTYTPPFGAVSALEDEQTVDLINAANPDILWIGLSTPKQEKWMYHHIGRLNVPVMIGVGAAFDFLSGAKKQAPRWMQRAGLEWFFRVLVEPRRLARRYVYIVPVFIGLMARDYINRCIRFK